MTLAGSTLLGGQFTTGALSVSGSLSLNTGNTLAVSGDALIGDGSAFAIDGAAALLTVGGKLTFGGASGSLYYVGGSTVTGGARVRTGSVAFNNAYGPGSYALSVDTSSSFEVGTANNAAAGTITVDAGAQMDLGAGQSYIVGIYAPSIVNKGSIVSSGVGYGNSISATTVMNTGALSGVGVSATSITNSGTIRLINNDLAGTVTNNGTIVVSGVDPHDVTTFYDDVSGSGQIQIGNGGNLTTQHVASTNAIVFTGSTGALTISANSLDSNGLYNAPIQGFGAGDVLNFAGTVTSATYANGILTLSNGATTVARLSLIGNYAGASFRAISLDSATTQISLQGTGDTASAPAGTAAGHAYAWSGPVSASWDVAGNWIDNSMGVVPAAAAPGRHDGVTIHAAAAGAIQAVSGTGETASLALEGDTLLDGRFTAGSLTSIGALLLRSGDNLAVSGPAQFGSDGSMSVDGIDTFLTVAGTLTFGDQSATQVAIGNSWITNGGMVQANSVVFANAYGPFTAPYISLSIDVWSSLEVGNLSVATPGTLTVDTGALMDIGAGQTSLTRIVAPNVFNSGSIVSSGTGYGNALWATTVNNSGTVNNVEIAATAVINSGTIALASNTITGRVNNDGIIIAGSSGGNMAAIVGDVAGTGQIEIASDGQISTQKVNGGGTVAFVGANGVLSISAASIETSGFFGATILGFGTSDAIQFGGTVSSVAYASGVLTLYKSGTAVGALNLAGNYANATFALSQQTGYAEITVSGVTASPVLAGGGTGGTYIGGGKALAIAPNLTVADASIGTITGAELTITGGFQFGDQLGFTAANGITGAYNPLTGVLSLSGTASLSAYRQLLDSITYASTAFDPTNGGSDVSRSVTAIVYDGSQYSNAFTSTLATAAGTPHVANDFNGDGRSDPLLRSDAGDVASWISTSLGGFVPNDSSSTAAGRAWHIAGTGDFNGDGRSDILWRDDDGTVAVWRTNYDGSFAPVGASFAGVGTDWHVEATGDFNADGRSDILWRNDNGTIGVWQTTGSGGFAPIAASFAGVGSDWHVAATADFDGDGRSDILWRSDTGTVAVWQATSSGSFTPVAASFTGVGTNWNVVGTGDFDGDGRSDIFWRGDDGTVGVWQSNANGSFTPVASSFAGAGTDWHVAAIGDYNGDGRSDILWRGDSGAVVEWLATSSGNFTYNIAASGRVGTDWQVIANAEGTGLLRATNDFDGDGRSDILWRSDSGTVGVWQATSGGGFNSVASSFAGAGNDWHVAGVGDFNGDGSSDILWRNDNGSVSVWQAASNGSFAPVATSFSVVGTDWHVAGTGDFDGDGRSDILWRSDSGALVEWLATSNGSFAYNGASAANVGTDWHVAGTGDFDGDGRSDILWRNDNGTAGVWQATSGGGFASVANSFAGVGNDWHVASVADFSGDGMSDILWRNDDGTVRVWQANANGSFAPVAASYAVAGTDWHVAGTGDYNGDGLADILWRNDSGSLVEWLTGSNGSFSNNAASYTNVGTDWHVQAPSILFG